VNLLMIPVGFVLCQCMARLLSIRLTLVAIGIVVLAFIGAYAISNSLVDIWVVLAFGLVGFFGGKVGMDTGAMALGVILGPMIEENLGKSVDLSRSVDGGLMSVMFEGSINKVLIAALLLSLLTPFLLKLRNRKHAALLPEGPRPGWKTDLFAGIGFLAIAAAFLVQYEGLEGVSRVFPEVLTKLIGTGGAYFVGKGLWRRSREAAEPEGGEAVAWCKIGIICATSLCYAVLIPVFGFLVTTMGFIAGSTLILGDHSRGLPRLARTAIAFAIGFSLLVWAGFTLLLNVPVPEGMFL
jgi:putative tricarboxylic transport membrane protein